MPFQLTIAEGKEAGREFVFEQPQVVIGRTSECDVVLYDPGVSRKHARIFVEGAAYFVEDMGSSNGTKVNGSMVKKQKLADGDAVSLGPVVFSFSAPKDGTDPAAIPAPGPGAIANQNTRVFQMGMDQKPRTLNKGSALAPLDAPVDELEAMQRSQTRSMNAIRPRVSASNNGRSSPPVGIPAVRPAPMNAPPAVRRSGSAPAEGRLSAAERARIRRENPNLYGSLKLLWLEASGGARLAVIAFLLLCLAGGVAGTGYTIWQGQVGDRKPPPPEPNVLVRKPIAESFGCGDDVTYKRCDQKDFDFEFVTATKAVVVLHFQAQDVSDGEVVVSVNGADVGKVPADAMNATEVSHELLIPPEQLKRGQKNKVTFDNVRNPPNSDAWKIWNLWVEIAPLPDEPLDDLVRDANTAYQRGQIKMDRKDVGASNRYEAWQDFRRAWLLLESHPNPKPELYMLTRTKMHDVQKELDNECQKILMEARQYYSHKDWPGTRATLDHVKDFFPNNDQACLLRAEQVREELSL